eukprot:scaffold95821_cov19-Tisochrysis_lutea.AAC.1
MAEVASNRQFGGFNKRWGSGWLAFSHQSRGIIIIQRWYKVKSTSLDNTETVSALVGGTCKVSLFLSEWCTPPQGVFISKHSCSTSAVFTVYFPPAAEKQKVPVIYYLSGLTCTDENFISKAGAQRRASELGVALVAPDTSPRGLNVPGESDSWDFGVGAGFYLNATEPKWKAWRMYDWVVKHKFTCLWVSVPKICLCSLPPE